MRHPRLSRAQHSIPWGLLGMLALAGAIEQSVIRGNPALRDRRSESWSQAARHLKQAAPRREILCFGDSMVKCGLLPRVFRERTGRSALNLAVVGGSAPSSYFLLRRALDEGARPSTIVVDFNADLLTHEPASTPRPSPWAHLVNFRVSLELCRVARDPDLFAWISLARLFPSVKNRHDVRDYVKATLKTGRSDRGECVLLLYRNWNFNQGAMIDPKRPFQDSPAPPATLPLTSTWRPGPVNEHFFHEFLDLAARHRIPVVWLLPPFSPGTQLLYEYQGIESRFEDFIRRQSARHPNFVLLDARHAGFEASVFHDAVHLDRDGALALSDAVADFLRQYTPVPANPTRWVTLRMFRKPPSAVPIKDLGQSLVAIQKLGANETVRR